jgi:serine/threonine protein kinase
MGSFLESPLSSLDVTVAHTPNLDPAALSQARRSKNDALSVGPILKPGNILLRTESPERSEGLGLWPLLTDFGLSKDMSVPSGIPLTFEGEVLGTLSYMSPEQVLGQPLKTQSELFPLVVILYELVYGQHPFLAEGDFQTRNNIVQAIPIKPKRDLQCVPAALDAIISKCLRKQPEERYLHASDLARDLDHFLNGEPISVSPPTSW